MCLFFFFFQAEDGIRDRNVTGVQTCALPIFTSDASLFAIMAVGATIVIISGGIDLSVGSIYALAAVLTALTIRHSGSTSLWIPLGMCLAIGILCGTLNGVMVSMLRVHPFIIT